MKISKKILVGFIGIFLLLIVLPFLIPIEKYIAQFEQEASKLLGVPVEIENAHIYFIPSPRLSVQAVVIGRSQDITVKSITVIPSIRSLISDTRTIQVHVEKPVIHDSAIPFVSELIQSKSTMPTASSVEITQINIQGLALLSSSTKLPVFNIQANFAKGMQFLDALVTSDDGQLEANIQPNQTGHSIVVKIEDWAMPTSRPWQIDQGRIDMVLNDQQLAITKMTLQMYGGMLNGTAKLDWQKNWRLNGQLHVKEMSLKAPTQMMNSGTYMDGRLVGSGSFTANAKHASQLRDQLRADFTFTVNQGVLYGLDLVKVASLLVKQSVKGGQTQFDTFTGQLAVSGKRYHLKRIHVSSGLISANGNVKINEHKKLDGTGEVALKQSAGLVSVPLIISGTLGNPQIYPSKAALAGAAVGTAILGPGLGTSLGSKAGSAIGELKDLFGGSD